MNDEEKILNYLRREIVVSAQAEIGSAQDLFSTGILDSVLFIKTIGFLEDTFDVKFRRSQLTYENFNSVEKMLLMIKKIRDEGGRK